jgi:predicted DNA-binding transcriptional regulator AlpA
VNADQQIKPLPADLQDDALVDVKVFARMLGMSSATPIYDRLRRGEPGFPQPVRLSKRCTRWKVRSIRAYLADLGAAA